MMKSLFRIFLFAMMLLPVACAEIELPAQLQVIEAEAFCGASELSAVRLCEGITEIRAHAFADSGLTEISLPRSLSSIADSAFDGCGNVVIEVLPDTYAWDWCIAQGMTGAALTSVEQTDSDSARITWSAPDGILCDVLLNPGDEWTTSSPAGNTRLLWSFMEQKPFTARTRPFPSPIPCAVMSKRFSCWVLSTAGGFRTGSVFSPAQSSLPVRRAWSFTFPLNWAVSR